MIIAVLIKSDSREFVFTPESDGEKVILGLFSKSDENTFCKIRTGPFYIAGGNNINHAMDDSTMLVFEESLEPRG